MSAILRVGVYAQSLFCHETLNVCKKHEQKWSWCAWAFILKVCLIVQCSPKMATTMSSLRISMDPLARKQRAVRTSPPCTSVSPGGAWVVLKRIASARRQPLVAPRKALQLWSNVLFRWRQISACRHSGKPFSTCRERKRQKRTEQKECSQQTRGDEGQNGCRFFTSPDYTMLIQPCLPQLQIHKR